MIACNWSRDESRSWCQDWESYWQHRDTVGFIVKARESLPYWLWSVREILNAVRGFLNALKLAQDVKAEVRMTPAMWRALYVLEEVARQYEGAVFGEKDTGVGRLK